MLKKTSSRKRSFILPFLALFYFVFGANAIHPLIHKNHVTETVVHKVHGSCAGHHLSKELIFGLGGEDTHSSCPICDYLALSSVLTPSDSPFFAKAYPSQQVDVIYMLSEHATYQAAPTIRGPPRNFYS